MAKQGIIENPIPQQEAQYYLSSPSNGVNERLSLDSKFLQRMSRGGMGNLNMFMTTAQQSTAKQYIPAAKWSKDERRVFLLLQDIVDQTGTVPTVAQLAQVSNGRTVANNSGNGVRSMSQSMSLENNVGVGGLTTKRVQRALNKLQQRGIVLQAA